MGSDLAALLAIFELEPVERDLFRGISHDLGFPNLFGGQVLGQALIAGARTVKADRAVHSCHAYFLRPGDAGAPVIYQVGHTRDGGSFSTRHIQAIQHGRPIFEMTASFQVPEQGFDHQDPMPADVPVPEELDIQQRDVTGKDDRLSQELLIVMRTLEVRPVPLSRGPDSPAGGRYWFRAAGSMPDDPGLHQALLAYASDFELVATSLRPHGVSLLDGSVFAASLDHALWFHRPFRVDEWLLYDIHSPNACNARGLSWGRVFTRDGRLVASVAQEGLIRKRK